MFVGTRGGSGVAFEVVDVDGEADAAERARAIASSESGSEADFCRLRAEFFPFGLIVTVAPGFRDAAAGGAGGDICFWGSDKERKEEVEKKGGAG